MLASKTTRAKVARQDSGAAALDSARYKDVKIVKWERTHQRKVSTVAMDATTAALVATAFM